MPYRKCNLLILEDSYYTRCDVAAHIRILHPHDYRILMTESIVETCELIEREDVDLIIADTTVCDGETIDFFRDYGLRLPVIFYSGYDCVPESLRGLNVVAYIKLPITFESIRNSLDRYENLFSENRLIACTERQKRFIPQAGPETL